MCWHLKVTTLSRKCVLGGVLWSMQQLEKFPEMRQNERRGKFIRLGDAFRTRGRLKEGLTPLMG